MYDSYTFYKSQRITRNLKIKITKQNRIVLKIQINIKNNINIVRPKNREIYAFAYWRT